MSIENKTRDYMLCVCKGKTLGEIEDFILEKDITDLNTLCEVANIGNKCGACREMLEELIEQCSAKKQPQE